ncbi:MAG: adenylosuccinate lyase [Candidatus Latescibacteria bacterium]|nr:adenylosuccinate lyase [Candidatus Latescibacterota bacterium]
MTSNSYDVYTNPLISRYASSEMKYVFSDKKKFSTWRKLWLELAKAQKICGLPVTDQQIAEIESHIDDLNIEVADQYEKKTRHDVMAHILALSEQCPAAKPIIHLGATSAYVGDNTDLIQMRDALEIIRAELVSAIRNIKDFALKYREMPTLGFTHFQPAQLTTVGKRACLWLQDLIIDYYDLVHLLSTFRFRGVKGTTGTQASFLSLFDGDHEKVKKLDRMVSEAFGFSNAFRITGQTYTRKIDARVAAFLSGVCQSLTKMSNDIRLLAHLKEIEEPFESTQVGSSAMPYKRNPMRSERIASLARFVISLESSPAITVATQWFERTLDDSANKRLSIPQMFLGTDAVLRIAINVTSGLVVYPAVISKRIQEELPFIASENILMEAVKKGGDRQQLHEEIRKLAQEAGRRVKEEGDTNQLLNMISESRVFDLDKTVLSNLIDPKLYIGRAPEQVDDFIKNEVNPLLEKETACSAISVELKV